MKSLVLALLFSSAVMADQFEMQPPRPPAASQASEWTVVNPDAVTLPGEWVQWQAPASEPFMPPESRNVDGAVRLQPKTEVEGCWWCERVETLRSQCRCMYQGESGPVPGVVVASCSSTCPDNNGMQWWIETRTIPYQGGFRKRQIANDYYVTSMASGASASFQQWLLNTFQAPPGGYPSQGGTFSQVIDGESSASEIVETMVFEGGTPTAYTVYIYRCELTGSPCSKTTSVWQDQ